MRILHVISDENVGGAGILLFNLLSCLDPKAVQSFVAIPEQSALRERLEALHVQVLPLRYPCDRLSLASVYELVGHIRRTRAETVHANAALTARVAGRICGIGVIHTRHCCFPPQGLLCIPPIRFLSGIFNRLLSDRVIATAEAARENLEYLGIPRKRIRVILNGSHSLREVDAEELDALRKSLELRAEDFIVGICARLEKCKGHETFLHGARLAIKNSPQIPLRFLIIGDGSLRVALEGLAEKLGILDAVRFTGFVKDPAPFYRLMRINVNCSSGTETSCLALSEGMSASLPMVVSDYGGNRAMLGDQRAGILVPVGDSRALAHAICRIAGDPILEQEMRAASRERFESHYTAERMAREVFDVYCSLSK